MAQETGIRLELEQRMVRSQFEELKDRDIIGNAYSDHDLLNELPELSIRALAANLPDLAFEIDTYLVTKVMGCEGFPWQSGERGFKSGFVEAITEWNFAIWPSQQEAEARRQEEDEDAAWPWGRPQGF